MAVTLKNVLIFVPLLAYGLLVIHWLAPLQESAGNSSQRAILCLASVMCSVPALLVHWMFPPHPKFVLLPRRKYCIRLHIIAGTIEFLAAVAAYFSGLPAAALVMGSAAVLLHTPTAALQAPIVFGSRILMLPSYVLCVALHFYCAVRLLLEPTSRFWLTQTFLAFSIYAWVRLFYYVLHRWRLFAGWRYSAAVLFAGLLIGPAVLGPLAFLFLISFIGLYVALYWVVTRPTSDEMLDSLWEHRRGAYQSTTVHRLWSDLREWAGELSQTDHSQGLARTAFDALDKDEDGVLGVAEIREVVLRAKMSPQTRDHFVGYLKEKEIDFQTFNRHIWNFGVLRRIRAAPARPSIKAPEEQAKAVFELIDFDGSKYISAFELRMLLLEWDLPEKDVEDVIRQYGGSQKEIGLEEFHDRMGPVWKFAYHDVMRRVSCEPPTQRSAPGCRQAG